MKDNLLNLLTVDGVDELLGTGRRIVYRLLAENVIKGFKLGNSWSLAAIQYVKEQTFGDK